MRNLLRVLYALVLLGCAGALAFFAPRGVETDVFALLGKTDGVLAAFSRANASVYRVFAPTPEIAAELRAIAPFDEPIDPKALYELVRTKGKGLLGEKQAKMLGLNETNKIARATLRRDYTGVGLFPKEDDPYYFLNDFVLSLQQYQPQLEEGEEMLVGHSANPAADPNLPKLIEYARTHKGVALSGAPFHTALATKKSVSEINVLGAVSIFGVLVFGWLLFRSFRFVLPTLLVLAAGFLVGSAALFLLPGRPHVLSFLFGTTLIGLGVDYCYHRLHAANGRQIGAALLTTSCAFAPLLFAPVRVLREMSVFTLAGLLAIAAGVLLFVKERENASAMPMRRIRVASWVETVIGVLAAIVLLRTASLTYDPAAFNRMDPLLKAGESRVAEVIGGESIKFLPVKLEKWQHENAGLKAKMGVEPQGEFLTAEDLPREMTFAENGETYLLLPSERGVLLKDRLTYLFSDLTFETLFLLMFAAALMLVIAIYLFKRGAAKMVSPVLTAALVTAGLLAVCGVKFTFFHLIAFFMILGLGIDYAIFGGGRVVFYSFLTSLVGFGMLGFTSFPPTEMMGVTLALGLFFAYLFAPTSGFSSPSPSTSGSWHEQKEQAAGRFRLWLTFALYRFLGKDFCKLCAVFVVASAYPGFRKRCSFKKALSFAFGLLDKLDACTLRKNLPTMTVVGETGWMKGGCFLLSTHVGTIEVLPALKNVDGIVVHAFQQMTHNKLFTEMFVRHFDKRQFVLHPVEEIGVETAVEMQEAIARGEMVLMAGDRDPASGGKKGVFKFAKLMESPVYAITCIRTGWNAYAVNAKELNRKAIQSEYETFLAEAVALHPTEHFEF